MFLTVNNYLFAKDGKGKNVIARKSKTEIVIVLPDKAIPVENTAAEELKKFLSEITGAEFKIINEKQLDSGKKGIFIGNTRFAHAERIDSTKLKAEESVIKTVNGNIILSGGRPRGTLYAVYNFLENVLGCRWYALDCTKIPKLPNLTVPTLNLRISPAFAERDMYTNLPAWFDNQKLTNEWSWFVIRNQLNGYAAGNRIWLENGVFNKLLPQAANIGGEISLQGRPHTFYLDIPTKKYFKTHPEYFSERKGKRVTSNGRDGNQLCLTNPEVRKVMIEAVKARMRKSPECRTFRVCMNDGGGNGTPCDCAKCTKFMIKNGGKKKNIGASSLYFDFINSVAEGLQDEFPDNYIDTLAYMWANTPPESIKLHPKLSITVCLGNSYNSSFAVQI